MVLDVNPDSILHEISLHTAEHNLKEHAVELALLGEIDASRDLINLLSGRTISTKDNSDARYLAWAWNETGLWPEGMSDEDKSDEALANLRRMHETYDWGGVPKVLQKFDEEGLEACLTNNNPGRYGQSPAVDKPMLLVKALDISVRLSTLQMISPPNAHEDSAQLDEWVEVRRLDERSAEILCQIVSRWRSRAQRSYLVKAERLWPLFITGNVATGIR